MDEPLRRTELHEGYQANIPRDSYYQTVIKVFGYIFITC